jgi:CheY-like chemotaxis protein
MPLERQQLLVIEDNGADVELLEFALQDVQLDCEFIVIPDGEQALAWVRDHSNFTHKKLPDLAIVDLNLPKHDGVEVLEAMRASSVLARMPVLILSSSPRPSDVARVTTFAGTKYLTKPTFLEEYTEIANTVCEMLRKQG